MMHYKFVSWDIPAFETILTGRIPAALLAADNGNLQPLKDLHIATLKLWRLKRIDNIVYFNFSVRCVS